MLSMLCINKIESHKKSLIHYHLYCTVLFLQRTTMNMLACLNRKSTAVSENSEVDITLSLNSARALVLCMQAHWHDLAIIQSFVLTVLFLS